jgi:hypothetical protein
MAKTVIRTDDMNGDEGAVEVLFSFQGTDYSIDLADTSIKEMEEFLGDFIEKSVVVPKGVAASAKAGAKRSLTSKKSATGGETDVSVIRAWAVSNGFPNAPKRGRLPVDIREAYEAANPAE